MIQKELAQKADSVQTGEFTAHRRKLLAFRLGCHTLCSERMVRCVGEWAVSARGMRQKTERLTGSKGPVMPLSKGTQSRRSHSDRQSIHLDRVTH
jgi:hypothetical protein